MIRGLTTLVLAGCTGVVSRPAEWGADAAAPAAVIFSVLTLIVLGFQLALALGMPWGSLTWGGKFPGVLPASMRGAAVVSALVLAGLIGIVWVRAGALLPEWQPLSRVAIWGVVAYCALGVLANAATPSRWERRLWLPIVCAMLASGTVVALS
jgi:hypothetical protein